MPIFVDGVAAKFRQSLSPVTNLARVLSAAGLFIGGLVLHMGFWPFIVTIVASGIAQKIRLTATFCEGALVEQRWLRRRVYLPSEWILVERYRNRTADGLTFLVRSRATGKQTKILALIDVRKWMVTRTDHRILDAAAAAGFEVIRVGEPPSWKY